MKMEVYFINLVHINCVEENEYVYLMKETGLFDLLKNHIIKEFSDYITGVEVGLDSNARKKQMAGI